MTAQAQSDGITQEEAEQAFLKANRPTSLIQRFATTDEVANMIVYTCSEQASATTGAALRVDGGVVRFVAQPRPSARRKRPAGPMGRRSQPCRARGGRGDVSRGR